MVKVVKFGGSSLASAKQFKKVGDIIRADKSRRFVVPSAPGKRSSDDTKVTDLLYQMYDAAGDKAKYSKIFTQIRERFEEIIEGLGLDLNLDDDFRRIEEDFWRSISRAMTGRSSRASTVRRRTAQSRPSPAAAPTSRAL